MSENKPKPFFNDEKKRIAQEWLNNKWKNKTCECCGNSTWMLQTDLVATPVFAGGLVIGGNTYPFLPAICSNCGNTKLFNAVMMGVLKPEKAGEDGQ